MIYSSNLALYFFITIFVDYQIHMRQKLIDFIQEKSPNAKPLYLVIRGSQAYGTNLPTSDTDYSGVFIQSMDDIFGNKYVEQINDDKNDTVIYEIRRFLELLQKNNPTVLELLNTPEDCVLYKDPIFDEILKNRDSFITKICANSFGGYAKTQIQKEAHDKNEKISIDAESKIRRPAIRRSCTRTGIRRAGQKRRQQVKNHSAPVHA
jgi:hypothetical protein